MISNITSFCELLTLAIISFLLTVNFNGLLINTFDPKVPYHINDLFHVTLFGSVPKGHRIPFGKAKTSAIVKFLTIFFSPSLSGLAALLLVNGFVDIPAGNGPAVAAPERQL